MLFVQLDLLDITQKKELRAAVAKSLGLKGTQHWLLRTANKAEVRDISISIGLLKAFP